MTTYTITEEQMEHMRDMAKAIRDMTGLLNQRGFAVKLRSMMSALNDKVLSTQPDPEKKPRKTAKSSRPHYFSQTAE